MEIRNNGSLPESVKERKRFRWTQQSFDWFAVAAEHTRYYERLYEVIGKYADSNSTVIDLGCGAGNLGFFLSNKVKTMTQMDMNPLVIENISRVIKNRGILNVNAVLGDWHRWNGEAAYDVAIISYSNGSVEHFEKLKEISSKWIIIILAQSNKVNSFNIGNSVDLKKKRDSRETVEDVIPWLTKNDVSFEYYGVECEFGQVFNSTTEAEEFVEHYFGPFDTENMKRYISENLVSVENRLYLPHMKKSGIMVIDREQFE